MSRRAAAADLLVCLCPVSCTSGFVFLLNLHIRKWPPCLQSVAGGDEETDSPFDEEPGVGVCWCVIAAKHHPKLNWCRDQDRRSTFCIRAGEGWFLPAGRRTEALIP